MRFEINPTTASANNTPAQAVNAALEGLTPQEKVKYWLDSPRYQVSDLTNLVSYPAEGTGSDGGLLVVPADLIQSESPAPFRVWMGHPKIQDLAQGQALMVKIGVSYIPVNGKCETLIRGGGDNSTNSGRWRNFTSSHINLGSMIQAGYFDAEYTATVWQWALQRAGQTKQLGLVMPQGITAVLRPTITKTEVEPSGGRDYKLRPGDEAGLGLSAIGFAGARLFPLSSTKLLNGGDDDHPSIDAVNTWLGLTSPSQTVDNAAGL